MSLVVKLDNSNEEFDDPRVFSSIQITKKCRWINENASQIYDLL